jgi:hypothetical protein
MNADSKAERQMNKKVVRSVAMRSYRQKQQSRRTKEEEAKTRNRTRAVKPRSEPKRDDHSAAHSQTPGLSNAWIPAVNTSNISWLLSASPSSYLSDIDSGFGQSLGNGSLSGNHSDVDSVSGQSPQGNALCDAKSRAFTPIISPISLLGAGRIDPFRMSSADTSAYIHELIDHCKSVSL